ncbi:uncharacterized protein LOC127751925, partial [Frankliniella occidentalis]|uniref:Uncharacterized protein LOC127751925 n=1 Tax=Frankliniella occidentalis TaxID=133901 RepID=A0A9C6XAU4_FRAOC
AIAQIQELLSERKEILEKYNNPMQPLPVLLGPLSNIRQSFVVLDDTRWELHDPFTAFIATFKIFFGLNTGFPFESRHLWLFLQKTLFGISSDKDYTGHRGLRSFIAARLKEFDQYEVPPL